MRHYIFWSRLHIYRLHITDCIYMAQLWSDKNKITLHKDVRIWNLYSKFGFAFQFSWIPCQIPLFIPNHFADRMILIYIYINIIYKYMIYIFIDMSSLNHPTLIGNSVKSLSFRFPSNWKEYDRSDSFIFVNKPNEIPFGPESTGKVYTI